VLVNGTPIVEQGTPLAGRVEARPGQRPRQSGFGRGPGPGRDAR